VGRGEGFIRGLRILVRRGEGWIQDFPGGGGTACATVAWHNLSACPTHTVNFLGMHKAWKLLCLEIHMKAFGVSWITFAARKMLHLCLDVE
jgi:hypothetical protein